MPRYLDRLRYACALLATLSHLFACDSKEPKPTPALTASPLPRYWLARTTLFDRPGGAPRLTVEQPTLVELSANGRVRGVAPRDRAIDGFLAEEVRREPGRRGGLMLYAQREADLHWRRPDGPLLGRLHPGAFVSVAAQGQGHVPIGALPFDEGVERVVAFVDRSALGIEPRALGAARATGNFEALQVPSVVGWRDDLGPHPTQAWQSLPCRDIWLSADRRTIAQSIDGVELLGNGDDLKSWAYNPVVLHETLGCPARVASSASRQTIPLGYRRLALPDSDPLGAAIEQRRSLYWLLSSAEGPRCDAWQFEPSRAKAGQAAQVASGFLTRGARVSVDGKTVRARLPFEYAPRDGSRPAVLHFRTLEVDGRVAMKCECDYRYAVLSAEGGELGVSGHPLPSDFSAYDPGQLERWFLSADQCQAALRDVTAALVRDGTSATRLGFHAQIMAWGL